MASKFARFESSWLHCVRTIAREVVQNVSLIWTNSNNDWEQSGPIRPKARLCCHCRSHSSVASLTAPEQWCVFCTPSLATYPMYCLSTGFKYGKCGGQSWGEINSGVSFCNNSAAACVQWAFQVSQGSVETLFRWSGKRLHHLEANIFGRRCTKFHQNCPIFIEDITKKRFSLFFFLDTVYTCFYPMIQL